MCAPPTSKIHVLTPRVTDHVCLICEYSRRSTVCNHPLKPQIGAPWDAKAHQMSLLFLLSQPRRPGHQSWCVRKVHICILHFTRRPAAALWVEEEKWEHNSFVKLVSKTYFSRGNFSSTLILSFNLNLIMSENLRNPQSRLICLCCVVKKKPL